MKREREREKKGKERISRERRGKSGLTFDSHAVISSLVGRNEKRQRPLLS